MLRLNATIIAVSIVFAISGSLATRAEDKTSSMPAAVPCSDTMKFAWHISVPETLPVVAGDPIPVTISVGPCDVSHIRVSGQQIYEKVLGFAFSRRVFDEANDGQGGIKITARTARTLLLIPGRAASEAPTGFLGFYPEFGDYSGVLVLTADQLPEGEAVKLHIEITSLAAHILGFLALAAGVFGSSFLTPLIPDPAPDAAANVVRPLSVRISELRRNLAPLPDQVGMDHSLHQQVESLVDVEPNMAPETRGVLVANSARGLLQTIHGAVERRRRTVLHLTSARAQLLVSATSIALGLNSLVLTTSFGTPKDFLACLLYGLGAPLGSKAITSLVALAAR